MSDAVQHPSLPSHSSEPAAPLLTSLVIEASAFTGDWGKTPQEGKKKKKKKKKKKHLDTIFYSFLLGLFALEESSVSTLCGEEEDTRKAKDEWARWT